MTIKSKMDKKKAKAWVEGADGRILYKRSVKLPEDRQMALTIAIAQCAGYIDGISRMQPNVRTS